MAVLQITVKESMFTSIDKDTDIFSSNHITWNGWEVQSYKDGTITCHGETVIEQGLLICDAKLISSRFYYKEVIRTSDGKYTIKKQKSYRMRNMHSNKFNGTIGISRKGYAYFKTSLNDTLMDRYRITNYIQQNSNVTYDLSLYEEFVFSILTDGIVINLANSKVKVTKSSWVIILVKVYNSKGHYSIKKIVYSLKLLQDLKNDLENITKIEEYKNFIGKK